MKKQYHGVTVNDLYNNLYKVFNILVDEILAYESDTFSAQSSEITIEEAEKVAFRFVMRDIERRFATETMDGSMIDNVLYEIRNPNE